MSRNPQSSARLPTKPKTLKFRDHPDFRPNLTPRQIFQLGSFGGTYWRPIKSKYYKNIQRGHHHKYGSWWDGIPENWLSRPYEDYDKTLNRYKVKTGTTLEFWEEKGWIWEEDPYGWVQWYCEYYAGRRSPDDDRQVARWANFAGPKGRFRNQLIRLIKKQRGAWDDETVSPAIRQSLQHWGYQLTEKDFKSAG